LPPLWQTFSRFNPFLYMIDGFRFGFFGQADVNVFLSLGMLSLFVFILTVLNLYLLKKGVGLRT